MTWDVQNRGDNKELARMKGLVGWKRWAVIGVVVILAAVVGGPYLYIHFIEGKAPAPLTLAKATTSATATAAATDSSPQGAWTIASGSKVGYRVKEVLFGQSNEAVGRTSSVTGTATIKGTTVTAASFTADLTTVSSDKERRDSQFQGRIMNTASYPTATLKLTEPIELSSIPATGVQKTVTVKADLTLHGVTKAIEFSMTGIYSGSSIQVSGSIPIVFADWGIANPSFGPVSTEDNGILEFAITLAKA
jgi:polyisoprenoid-binding protein YceI